MFYNWFDHPLIEAWLERQLAASRLTTSHYEILDGNHVGPLCVARVGEECD
jgi:hypothetical protein